MVDFLISPPPRLAALDDEPGRLRALDRYSILDTARDEKFEKIVGLVREVLDVPMATVSLIAAERQWIKAASGIEAGECDRRVAFCDHTIRTRDVLTIEDATLDPRFADNVHVTGEPFIRSYAGAPLMTPDGYNLGALCAIDRVPRRFTDAQLGVLQRFAALVVEEMELRATANRDFLTAALTRRALCEQMTNAVMRFTIDRSRAALVVFDIDHFKAVNDGYGHATGDLVLRAVVGECRARLRQGEVLGRLGGEEFAILLPGATLHEAHACAERMRGAVAGARVPGCRPVTASFGIAALSMGQNVDQWLAAADSGLYAAKNEGRNRCAVVLGDDDEIAVA